jgi:hypothetical protein
MLENGKLKSVNFNFYDFCLLMEQLFWQHKEIPPE